MSTPFNTYFMDTPRPFSKCQLFYEPKVLYKDTLPFSTRIPFPLTISLTTNQLTELNDFSTKLSTKKEGYPYRIPSRPLYVAPPSLRPKTSVCAFPPSIYASQIQHLSDVYTTSLPPLDRPPPTTKASLPIFSLSGHRKRFDDIERIVTRAWEIEERETDAELPQPPQKGPR